MIHRLMNLGIVELIFRLSSVGGSFHADSDKHTVNLFYDLVDGRGIFTIG